MPLPARSLGTSCGVHGAGRSTRWTAGLWTPTGSRLIAKEAQQRGERLERPAAQQQVAAAQGARQQLADAGVLGCQVGTGDCIKCRTLRS